MRRPPAAPAAPALAALALAALALAACSPSPGPGRPLPPGRKPTGPAEGLRVDAELARGVLAYDVAWNGRGDLLASVELSTRFELVLRDLSRRADPRRIDLGPPDWDVLDVDVDAAGARVAVASLDGTVRVYDAATAAPLASWRLDAGATAVAFSPDGGWLATGADSGVLCLRRADDGALIQCVAAHAARVSAIAFSPGGEAIATIGWDGAAIVWESPSLAELARREAPGAVVAAAFSPDAHTLALGVSPRPPRRPDQDRALEGSVVLWRWTAPDAAPATLPSRSVVGGLSFTPDGHRLLVGGWDGSLWMWDPARAQAATHLDGVAPLIRAITVSPDGSRAAIAGFTGADLEGRSVALVQLLYPW
jgi:WD40 repeat protein